MRHVLVANLGGKWYVGDFRLLRCTWRYCSNAAAGVKIKMAEEFCEEYASSMKDLTFNSKPHITMLTMLAEENLQYAPQIVKVIEAHLQKVRPEAKLPAMYLIDSILKNVGQVYLSLFTQNIVSNFCSVFEKVDEKVRAQMYKLRQTWADIFPNKKLYAIDVRVKEIDPAWPILAQPPPQQSIHVNPRFLMLPSEDNKSKKLQEIQEEEMRQQLLAKQQELLKLQRQKLELELLQTQVLVEEQKRQLMLKEQQLRQQQTAPTDVQKALSLQQQLTNVAALAAVASQGMLAMEGQKGMKQGKPTVPGVREHNEVAAVSVSSAAVLPALANNKMATRGPPRPTDLATTTVAGSLPANVALSKPSVPPVGPNTNRNSVPHVNKQISHNRDSEIIKDDDRMQSKALNVKTTPKKSVPEKGGKDVSKGKEDEPKKQSPSPKKSKSSKQDTKTTETKRKSSGKSPKSSSSSSLDKDKRSRSKSSSPGKGKVEGGSQRSQSRKGDRYQASLQNRDRHGGSHSRSRSPGRQDKGRDRDERPAKRGRRSPRREKENDGKGLDSNRNKSSSSARDVDLRTPMDQGPKGQKREGRSGEPGQKSDAEPPFKKSKMGDPELDEIFGDKDQDYRQLDQPVPKLSPISERQGWAQYKASRPDEFKNPLRSRDNHLDPRDPFYFGKHDMDLRTPPGGAGPPPGVRGMGYPAWNSRDPRGIPLGRDGRPLRLERLPSFGHTSRFLPHQDPRLHLLNRSVCYQATQESDPNIPRALMFDRGAEIMKQADLQLKSGQLTVEQHREILEQLAKLYELQRMRHLQREQRLRESMLLQPEAEVITISPDSSPVREAPESKSDSGKPDSAQVPSEVPVTSDKKEADSVLKQLQDRQERHSDEEAKDSDSQEGSKRQPVPDVTMEAEIPVLNRPDASGSESQETSIPLPRHDATLPEEFNPPNQAIREEKDVPPQVAFPSALPMPPSPPRQRAFTKAQPILTVMIDDKPREVRFFGDTAVVLLDNNDPREIAFRGPPQEVIIGKQVVRLGFRDKNKEVEVDGCRYPIRFGAPTREIIINDVPYSAVFGGPPITATLAGQQYSVRLCGPTPEVYFGDKPRFDLLPQIMPEMGPRPGPGPREPAQGRRGSPLRWVNSPLGRDYELRDWRHGNGREGGGPPPFPQPHRPEWHEEWRGGRFNEEPFRHDRVPFREERRPMPPPPPINRGEYREFEPWVRRGEPPLREDFRPGSRGALPARGPPGRRGSPQTMMDEYYEQEARSSPYREPVEARGSGAGGYFQDGRFGPPGPQMMGPSHQGVPPPHRFEGPVRMTGPPPPPHQIPPHHGGMPNQNMRYVGPPPPPYGYGPQPGRGHRYPPPPPPPGRPEFGYPPSSQPIMQGGPRFAPPPIPVPQPPLNVQELFDKLVLTGIIPHVATNPEKKEAEEEGNKPGALLEEGAKVEPEKEKPPAIELNPESLKIKHSFVISQLYCGIQCSSCGVRFTAEQTDKYAQHLDWHFRQNRKEKDSARKALSRKWYYDVQDWVQFEEIEDLEERARSFFEIQASEEQTEGIEDSQPSVPAGENEEDKRCAVCHELFELYWNEDSEEWHYRVAIREEDKNYHPLCYEDFKEQQFQEANAEEKAAEDAKEDKPPSESEIKTEADADATTATEEGKESIKVESDVADDALASQQVMNDILDKMEDVKVAGEPTSLEASKENVNKDHAQEVAQDIGADIQQEGDVSEAGTTEEKEPVAPSEGDVDGLPAELKTEPMEEEQYEPLPIFNVMSCSYTVPPLIGLETEEPDSMEVDAAPEAVQNEPSQLEAAEVAPKDAVDEEQSIGVEATSEVAEGHPNDDADDGEQTMPEEQAEVSSSVDDAVVDEELVSETVVVSTTDEVAEDEEAVEVSSSGVEDDSVPDQEVVFTMRNEPVEQDETRLNASTEVLSSSVKREPVECDEAETEPMIEVGTTEDGDVPDPGATEVVADLQGASLVLSPPGTAEGSAQIPVPSPVLPPLHVKVEVDEDVTLKESSDVLSEFAFDPLPSPNENLQPAKEPSPAATEKEDDGSVRETTEQPAAVSDSGFVVLPPVNRGTELSGLCSIM